ncbi:PhzF family phenazine biosynthesis protein [Nonomuraea sp. NN258]|uniref:PhzF family phenazine biosynthesis protein n=1 Tax=Nonomuraea antri TaxID=2730852 RepID=UPI001569C14D|nr:PhzF family phenazine biosynthesis protein [Nonomuraea antri]NRQ31050.1 PhzF family phenazine biosynthesis protein [Nonomuraea antri]
MSRAFRQVDVFTATPYHGNPLAVVHDAEGLTTEEMRRFANWTNLSETTFLLPPTTPGADYRVRIFTTSGELPFAGHPTLGSCHAWLEAGGVPRDAARIVQECEVGLVRVRRTGDGLAFAAPPLRRSGPLDEPTAERVATALGIARSDIVAAAWADNGPGWVGVLLRDAGAVLALRPRDVDLPIGVAGPHLEAGGPADFEVRVFTPDVEDPVTGSFNASLAQWLLGAGLATAPYTAAQGTVLGRSGRVRISTDAEGDVWVGGSVVTCVTGRVEL